MLRKSLLGLLSVLVSACGSGPILQYCTVDSRTPIQNSLGQCSDGEKDEVKPIAKMDKFACMSPGDRQRFLSTCKRNQSNPPIGVNVTYCVLDCADPLKRCGGSCSDGTTKTIYQLENFSCLSPRHNEQLIKYCKFGE